MKANKRVRDLNRRGETHLTAEGRDGVVRSTTTFPTVTNKVKATKALRRR